MVSLCASCPEALKYHSLKKRSNGSQYKQPIEAYYCNVQEKNINKIITVCPVQRYPVKHPITEWINKTKGMQTP